MGMMEQLDQSVGIVLAKLDELGIADNTVVTFALQIMGASPPGMLMPLNLPLRGGKGRRGKEASVNHII